jgi:Flp pilus assembly secretin CpaC
MENGQVVSATRTQVDAGGSITATPAPNEALGMNFTYRGLLTDPMFRAVVHALETSGKARTLSVPKVTTVNNKEARMRIGEDFRYFDEYDVQQVADRSTGLGNTTYNSVLVPVGSPKLEELGIELVVAPSVGADMRTVNLTITPDISEFIRWEYYQTSGSASRNNSNDNNNNSTNASFDLAVVKLPIFRRSLIETEVVVQSGETVVMGGLITSQETRTQNSVPFLSSIPFLGRFFQSEQIDDQKRNLLVFVTATILSDRGESLLPMPVGYRPAVEQRANPIQRMPAPVAALEAAAALAPQGSLVRGSVRLGKGSDADSRLILTLPDGRVITAEDLSAGFAGYKGPAMDVSFLAADGGLPQSLKADGAKFALLDDVLYRVSANRMAVDLFNADPRGNGNWVISMSGTEARIEQIAAQ